MKATAQTHQFLKEAFSGFVNRPSHFEFDGTSFVVCYPNGKKIQSYEFGIFRGVHSSWKHSFENYLLTFAK